MREKLPAIITSVIHAFLYALYLLFLLVIGPGCAFVSGWIEYDIVMGFFPQAPQLLPLVLVIAFEVAKLYFIFLYQHMTPENNYARMRKYLFLGLRATLMSFSALATLFFAFHQFHDPNYETELAKERTHIENAHTQQIAEIRQRYNAQTSQVDSICQNEKDRISVRYQPEIDRWLNAMKQEEKRTYKDGSFDGPVYLTYKANWEGVIKRRDEVINQVECDITRLQEAQRAEITALQSQKDSKLKLTKTDLRGSMKASNPAIAATIMVLYQSNDESQFPYKTYAIWIIILSFFITLNMEGIIYASFTDLSAQYGHAFMAGFKQQEMKEKLKDAHDTINRFENLKSEAYKERIIKEKETIEETLKQVNELHQKPLKPFSFFASWVSRLWKQVIHFISSFMK